MAKDNRPYKAQTRTYLQGTLLKLYYHHLENQGIGQAEYLRSLVRQDLTQRYEVNQTGGIVKIKKS